MQVIHRIHMLPIGKHILRRRLTNKVDNMHLLQVRTSKIMTNRIHTVSRTVLVIMAVGHTKGLVTLKDLPCRKEESKWHRPMVNLQYNRDNTARHTDNLHHHRHNKAMGMGTHPHLMDSTLHPTITLHQDTGVHLPNNNSKIL